MQSSAEQSRAVVDVFLLSHPSLPSTSPGAEVSGGAGGLAPTKLTSFLDCVLAAVSLLQNCVIFYILTPVSGVLFVFLPVLEQLCGVVAWPVTSVVYIVA